MTSPESLPPGEAFDPTKPMWTRDGREVSHFGPARADPDNIWLGKVGDNPVIWRRPDGRSLYSRDLDLVNTPSPVSVSASKCDRPGQADAAVAEAARYEWRRKVDFDGPGPWYPCDRSWIDHLAGNDLYETRSLYVTPEAALLAAKPRSEWRPIEAAPSGKWVLLNYGEVFASHTGYRQNDGKWVHPGGREPAAWMLLPSTKLCPLPAPPTSAPSPPVDHAGGQGERKLNAPLYGPSDPKFEAEVAAVRDLIKQDHRTPTPAAPAPGREDGESDAAFVKRMDEDCSLYVATGSPSEQCNWTDDWERLIALARTPARTDGGVTEAEVDAALKAFLEAATSPNDYVRDILRKALEAARAAETAGGAGETDETRNDCPRCSNIDALGQCEHPMPNDGQPPCIKMLEAARTTPNRAGEKP